MLEHIYNILLHVIPLYNTSTLPPTDETRVVSRRCPLLMAAWLTGHFSHSALHLYLSLIQMLHLPWDTIPSQLPLQLNTDTTLPGFNFRVFQLSLYHCQTVGVFVPWQ